MAQADRARPVPPGGGDLVRRQRRRTRPRRRCWTGSGRDGSAGPLPGGLRVVTESVPGCASAPRSASGSGSAPGTRRRRWPAPSHYLEHLLFKGTPPRSAQEIADAVDAVGGELNAFTSHEYTCYYARMLAEEVQLAVELVVRRGARRGHRRPDVETERMVILEEIAMRDDDPADLVARPVRRGAVRRASARAGR